MPLVEVAIAFVASKVLDYLVTDAIGTVDKAASARVRAWLGRDPAKLAMQVALARTEARFADHYPQWHDALFDEAFLAGPAAPILARALTRGESVAAPELAQAWADHVGGATGRRHLAEIEPAVVELITWWREELGRHEVFRPALDSRALNSIAVSTAQTAAAAKDTADALQALREELLAALRDLDRSTLRSRYPALEELIDWPSHQRVHTHGAFVGREWVFQFLHDFAHRNRSGYIRIVADAGLGKTALATAIAARADAPAYFFSESEGRTRPDLCLNHLSAELMVRHGLRHDRWPEHAGENVGFLARLLAEAASGADPLWLVIDALDEARPTTPTSVGLPLPDDLPSRTYVVVTHRPGSYPPTVKAGSGTRIESLVIEASADNQLADVRDYLRHRATHDVDVTAALDRATPPLAADELVDRLATVSEGNFMYAAYALDDVAFAPARSLDDESVPRGLSDYYRLMWDAMATGAMADGQQWQRLHGPVIAHVAVAGEPVTLQWLADHTGHAAGEIQRLVLRQWRRFLRHSGDPERWHTVHQSFREFLASTNELDLAAAHRSIADFYYGDKTRWATHEGYAYRHLAAHLSEIGDEGRMTALIDNRDWQQAQFLTDPSGDAFLSDVTQAWSLLAEIDAATIARHEAPQNLLPQALCALMLARSHSSSLALPPELLSLALTVGTWPLPTILRLIAHMPRTENRIESLTALLRCTSGGEYSRVLAEAHLELGDMPETEEKLNRLAALIPFTEGADRETVLTEALATHANVRSRTDPGTGRYAPAVATLARHLPREETPAVLALLFAASFDHHERAEALTIIAPNLPEAALPSAVEMAMDLIPPDRVAALVGLLPYVGKTQQATVQRHAMESAMNIRFPGDRARALVALAPHLPEPDRSAAFSQAVTAANAVVDTYSRAETFADVVGQLPTAQRDQSLSEGLLAAYEVDLAFRRAELLAQFVPYLFTDQKGRVLSDAMAAAAAVTNPAARAKALARVAPLLTEEDRSAALRDGVIAASQVDVPFYRALALKDLVPHLREDLVPDALEAAVASGDPIEHARALVALAPGVPEDQRIQAVSRALVAIRSITEVRERAALIDELAPLLDARQCGRAVSETVIAVGHADPVDRAQALAFLARHIPEGLALEALRAASAIEAEDQRAFALGALAADLPSCLTPDLLAAGETITDSGDRGDFLRAVIAQGHPKTSMALAMAHNLFSPSVRAAALAEAVPHLEDNERTAVVSAALSAASAVPDQTDRAEALAYVAPHLSKSLTRTALAAAESLTDPDARNLALTNLALLAPDFPANAMPEARRAARSISDLNTRAVAVVAFARGAPSDWCEQAYSDLLADATGSADRPKPTDVLIELLPHLPDAILPQALEAAISLPDSLDRARVLAAAMPRLADDEQHAVVTKALTAVNEVNDDYYRVVALDAVIPHLAGEDLNAAIACAEDIRDADCRLQALSALAPRLDGEARERVLAGALDAAEGAGDPAVRLRVARLLRGLGEFDPAWLHARFVSALYEAAFTGEQNVAEVIGEIAPVLHLLWEW